MNRMIKVPKINSVVKVVTRYPNTYIFSKEKFVEHVTVGMVVPNDRFTPPGSFEMTTGRREYPVAIIALSNVISIEEPGKKQVASVKKTAPKTWTVRSSNGKDVYTVTLHNQTWKCTCVGFQFHRRCKHIDSKKCKSK